MSMFINENYESQMNHSQLESQDQNIDHTQNQCSDTFSRRKYSSIEFQDQQHHGSKQQGFFASFKEEKHKLLNQYSYEKSFDQLKPSFLQNHTKTKNISTNVIKSQQSQEPSLSQLTSPDKDNTINRILNDSDEGYLFKDDFLNKYSKKAQKVKENRNKQIFNLKQWMGRTSEVQSHELSISCTEVVINLFPKQSHSQIFTLTNTTSKKMMVKLQAIFPLIVLSKKSAGMDYDLQLQSNYAKMVALEAWQKKDIKLLLGKKYLSSSQKNHLSQDIEDQCDIFETLVLQYVSIEKQQEQKQNFLKITDTNPRKKIFIPINIYYCLPKLTLQFVGNTEIIKIPNTSIQQENVVQVKIKSNGFMQYPLDIVFKGVQHTYRNNNQYNSLGSNSTKLQLEIMTYGKIKAFPENVTLFGNCTTRIMLRKGISKISNNQNNNTMNLCNNENLKGVVTIKALNCGIIFVIGVVLL